jgi:hypothetical protein
VTIKDSPSTGFAEVAGNLLDGDRDGKSGGNNVVVLRGFG